MSAASGVLPLDQSVWKPKANPWLIAVVVSLAAFMEVLDTSIANVALPHMAGNLGASGEESTWVLTSYLVANAIVLPLSGWLVGIFGRKRFFMTCIFIFTASSLLCGIAPSLGLLLFFRVLQGAGGGGLQPMVQAILADTFPPAKRGLAFSLYGITAVCAPALGPTLGGWITDSYSWRWIFYINLPVGFFALVMVYRLVEDPPYLLKRIGNTIRMDYIGFSLLALGVGALQILLDKGQEDDWFGSRFIVTLAAVAAVCLVSLVIWELRQKNPIVDVRLFRNSNFSTACVMMFMVGAVSFATTVLMPQFLQTLLGYSAESAGMVMSAAGFLLLLALPVVGRLTTKVQARYLIAFGWMLLAITMFLSTQRIDLIMSFGAATRLRIIQYIPLGFIFVPATLAAYVGIGQDKSNAVAGLINFVRNIGSSVGTSVVVTVIARRTQFHLSTLVSNIPAGSERFKNAVDGLTALLIRGGLSPHEAHQQAVARIYGSIQAQAATLSYIDAYWILAIAAGIMFFMSYILKKNDPKSGGQISAH
ncbi:MAG TPA: DHA2 family efflux MFS transporter permease subunit [Candidatus Acidoferrales bacterium]|nr:DHA2 family efflux MFS transporter permease subunit [Candidatus Acidoferrales bacterium]